MSTAQSLPLYVSVQFHIKLMFTPSLAMVDDSTLTIGSVDQIQMLHIQTVPLGESARFVALYVCMRVCV